MGRKEKNTIIGCTVCALIIGLLCGIVLGRLIERKKTVEVEPTTTSYTEAITEESTEILTEPTEILTKDTTTEEVTTEIETEAETTVSEATYVEPETYTTTTSYYANASEWEWLVRCVSAEEGGSYLRSWYAASCILNRCDATGMDITGVISDPGQFAVYTSGVMWEKEPTQDAINACNAVLAGDRNYEVYYFASYDAHSGYATIIDIVDGEYFYKR